jgi:hypothetical protein
VSPEEAAQKLREAEERAERERRERERGPEGAVEEMIVAGSMFGASLDLFSYIGGG